MSETTQVAEAQFSTQVMLDFKASIIEANKLVGAPWPPLPPSFALIPAALNVCQGGASAAELARVDKAREPFHLPGYRMPFMNDVVRASRLLVGAHAYVEVGIFDRGNLACMSEILADDAVIVGVDVHADELRDRLIQEVKKPGQRVEIIIGDSRAPETVAKVRAALAGRRPEGIFIDGGHDAYTVLCDYYNFGQFVADDGHVMFHDSLWEGDPDYKGVSDALAEIDRLDPIYLVCADHPAHRWMRSMWREPIWGCVGILPMAERACSKR